MTTTAQGLVPTFHQGDRMAKALDTAGISRGEMADRLKVSTETIRRWTQMTSPIKPATLIAWATITGVDLDWLQTGKLPRLDSNQRPFGYWSPQASEGVEWVLAA